MDNARVSILDNWGHTFYFHLAAGCNRKTESFSRSSYLEVPLHFIEDILAGAAQQNGAGLGVLTVLDEREILVADFANLG